MTANSSRAERIRARNLENMARVMTAGAYLDLLAWLDLDGLRHVQRFLFDSATRRAFNATASADQHAKATKLIAQMIAAVELAEEIGGGSDL